MASAKRLSSKQKTALCGTALQSIQLSSSRYDVSLFRQADIVYAVSCNPSDFSANYSFDDHEVALGNGAGDNILWILLSGKALNIAPMRNRSVNSGSFACF